MVPPGAKYSVDLHNLEKQVICLQDKIGKRGIGKRHKNSLYKWEKMEEIKGLLAKANPQPSRATPIIF